MREMEGGCETEGGILSIFRRIEIRRPQYPWILKWIDREFQVIYINLCADPDAKIIQLLTDDEDGEEETHDCTAVCAGDSVPGAQFSN